MQIFWVQPAQNIYIDEINRIQRWIYTTHYFIDLRGDGDERHTQNAYTDCKQMQPFKSIYNQIVYVGYSEYINVDLYRFLSDFDVYMTLKKKKIALIGVESKV